MHSHNHLLCSWTFPLYKGPIFWKILEQQVVSLAVFEETDKTPKSVSHLDSLAVGEGMVGGRKGISTMTSYIPGTLLPSGKPELLSPFPEVNS